MNSYLFSLLLSGLFLFLTTPVFAQSKDNKNSENIEKRFRIGRIVYVELSTKRPELREAVYSQKEDSLKLAHYPSLTSIKKLAFVAVTICPDNGRTLSIYDYVLRRAGTEYRCLAIKDDARKDHLEIENMNHERVYTLYFGVEKPEGENPKFDLVGQIEANGKDCITIEAKNINDQPLTLPLILRKELNNFLNDTTKITENKKINNITTENDSNKNSKSLLASIKTSDYYSFDTVEDNTIMSFSKKRSGRLSGKASIKPGHKNNCLDCTLGYVELYGDTPINYGQGSLGTQYSINFWVKLNSQSPKNSFLFVHANGNNINGSDHIIFKIEGSRFIADVASKDAKGEKSTLDFPVISIADKEWHMITFTTDFKKGSFLYLDGKEKSNMKYSSASIASLRENIFLGRNPKLEEGTAFNGCLDELYFFDTELSATQVEALYKN